MGRKQKRILKKVFKELLAEPAAPLSMNRGRLIRIDHCPNKLNAKKRRHRGWVTARWAGKGKYKLELLDGNDPIYFFDEWRSLRDGLHYDFDPTNIRDEYHLVNGRSCRDCSASCTSYGFCSRAESTMARQNKKQKLFLKRRKAAKERKKEKEVFINTN
jgi:hypothetical protein